MNTLNRIRNTIRKICAAGVAPEMNLEQTLLASGGIYPRYRPHPKDGEGTVFTGVSVHTNQRGGGGYPITTQQYFHWSHSTGSMSFLGEGVGASVTGPRSFSRDPSPRFGSTPVPGAGTPVLSRGYLSPRWEVGGILHSRFSRTHMKLCCTSSKCTEVHEESCTSAK